MTRESDRKFGFLNIVGQFKVSGRLDCIIVEARREGASKSFYYGFVGTYGKPSKFLTKLAQKIDLDHRSKKKTYVGEHEVFTWGDFCAVAEYTANTHFTYLGWDTSNVVGYPGAITRAKLNTLMVRLSNDKPPYRRIAADLKRTALDLLEVAKSYNYSLKALEFVENIRE